jgi:uncharacterized protein YjiS (DUF1127 family)
MSASHALAGAAAPRLPFAALLGRVGTALRSWYRRKRAVAALHALSDRSLADIGLVRSEIETVVGAHHRRASAGPGPADPAPGRRTSHSAQAGVSRG